MSIHTEYETGKYRGNGKFALGITFLAAGLLLFLSKTGMNIPDWIISWPVFMIALGLSFMLRSGFRRPQGFILVILGLLFLTHEIGGFFDLSRFTGPLVFIVLGIFFLLRRNYPFGRGGWKRKLNRLDDRGPFWNGENGSPGQPDQSSAASSATGMGSPGSTGRETDDFSSYRQGRSPFTGTQSGTEQEFLNETSIMGSIKKNIYSKNFGGGDLTALFGGIELNLLNADICGTAVLDITQLFGGMKLIIPSNWQLVSEVSSLFGGLEDKRDHIETVDSGKKLIIKGTFLFAGLEVKSY